MAEKEKTPTAEKAPAADKKVKETEKEKKPSIFARAAAWLKTCKAECKKITWAKWEEVKNNSIIIGICVVIFGIVIGLLDYGFSQTIVGLSRII